MGNNDMPMTAEVETGAAAAAIPTEGETALPMKKEKRKKEKKQKPVKKLKAAKKLPLAWGLIILGLTFAVTAAAYVLFFLKNGQADTVISGAAVVLFMGFGAFGVYAALRQKDCMATLRRTLFICFCLLAGVLPLIVTMRIDIGFMPYLLAILLLVLMANEKVAMLASLPVACGAGLISGVAAADEYAQTAVVMTVIISSLTAVYALNIRKTRSSTFIAAALAGIAGVVTYCAVMMAGGQLFYSYWQTLLWILGSCLASGVLAVGLMPLFETVFDVASDARLNELLNNNNPLIKRLMTEAPGTYHHSLLVASLAEAAAEEVGANALLTRVSACYHDVGKLRSPLCFKENQKHDKNIHDELDPYESAKRIIAHQQDGVTLLEKNKLPRDVIRIVGEHHGDSVMVYFYDKAKRLAPEGTHVDEEKFRYPSHKPSSKESAILMLADCCEAAVRSLQNPTMQDIENKVREVITHKWDKRGSMLWDSPLTFIDIKKIEASFIKTFAALNHERVEYPDLEEIDVR
ncbi:MAG: HDIG domain-containing protein [Clostridia bacterium]|nr:HDIG domain-containing protein [Clostridia bacterium]